MIIRITVDPIQVALALGFLGPAWCDDSCQQHTNEGEAGNAKDSTHEQSRTNVVGMGRQESTRKCNSKSATDCKHVGYFSSSAQQSC